MKENDFFIFKLFQKNSYCVGIYIKGQGSSNDLVIAELLDMSIKEYINLGESYNGIDDTQKGLIFNTEQDGIKFVNFLNEKYILLLKLLNRV